VWGLCDEGVCLCVHYFCVHYFHSPVWLKAQCAQTVLLTADPEAQC